MTDKLDHQIAIWQKTVDVQMHFNDMCMRLRAISISALGVLLGASAISYRYGGTFDLVRVTIPYYLPVLFLFILAFIMVVTVDPLKNRIVKFVVDLLVSVGLVVTLIIGPAFPGFTIADQTIPIATLFIAIAICLNFGFWWLDRYWYHQLLRGAVDHNKQLEALIRKQVPGIELADSIKRRGDDPVLGMKIGGGHRISLFYALVFLSLLAILVGSIYGATTP